MPILIDTYNVLHTTGVLPPDLAGIDVQGLIGLLQSSRYRTQSITLVCDGSPPAAGEGRPDPLEMSIAIRYSGVNRPADDLIHQMIRASTAPRRLLVVSSDHEVQKAAHRRRCRAIDSEHFLEQLVADARLSRPPAHKPVGGGKPPAGAMSDAQVARWISLFRLDPETASIPSAASPSPPSPNVSPEEDESNANEGGHASPLEGDPGGAPMPPAGPHIPELAAEEVMPPTLIEQAERLWSQAEKKRSGRSDSPPQR